MASEFRPMEKKMPTKDIPVFYWRNHRVTPLPDVKERLDKFDAGYVPRVDDIWICGYPKCGTHWLNEMLHMLKTGTTDPAQPKMLYFAEMTDHTEWDSIPSPRILNTHLSHAVLPDQVKNCKIVFIVRNPKDVAVSLYCHMMSNTYLGYSDTWDGFFESFLADKREFDSWFSYMKEWWPVLERPPANILFLRFENVKLNPKPAVRRLAEFMGCDHSDSFYNRVVAHTDVTKMKETHANDQMLINGISEDVSRLIRKGVIGDWKNWFTEEQNKRFDDMYAVEMKGVTCVGIEKYMEL